LYVCNAPNKALKTELSGTCPHWVMRLYKTSIYTFYVAFVLQNSFAPIFML